MAVKMGQVRTAIKGRYEIVRTETMVSHVSPLEHLSICFDSR
jgi:hypothetical protein